MTVKKRKPPQPAVLSKKPGTVPRQIMWGETFNWEIGRKDPQCHEFPSTLKLRCAW